MNQHVSTHISRSVSNVDLVESFNDAVFGDHDFDRLEEFVAPDIVHVEHGEVAFEGVDALRDYFGTIDESYDDVSMEVREMLADDDTVVYSFRMHGVAAGPFTVGEETYDVTGDDLWWDGYATLAIEDGRIVESSVLTDEAGLLRQIGALPPRAA